MKKLMKINNQKIKKKNKWKKIKREVVVVIIIQDKRKIINKK